MSALSYRNGHDPIRDIDRLQEIADLDLLSPEVDGILQEIAAEAAQRFDLPIGLVSLVLDEAQHFAAAHGLGDWIAAANGTPVEWSFCANTVTTRDAFVVEDAEQDARVKDNPLVKIDGIRCYAGIPMISSRGHVLGSFCVIGTETRSFAEEEMVELRAFAARAVERIEARRRS